MAIADVLHGERIPMFAIDALYDHEDPRSTEKYKSASEKLWITLTGFSRTPVAHIENMKSRLASLIDQISQLKDKILPQKSLFW